MFGFFKRAHAETMTKAMVEQMVQMLRHQWGSVPPTVWRDPYVMAWMQIAIAGLLKLHSNGTLAGGDLGMPAARVWQHATGENPVLFIRAGAQAPSAPPGSVVSKAFDDATLWLAFMMRRPNLKYPRAKEVFDSAQRQDRESLAMFGEASDTMGTACAILFVSDICARVGEIVEGELEHSAAG